MTFTTTLPRALPRRARDDAQVSEVLEASSAQLALGEELKLFAVTAAPPRARNGAGLHDQPPYHGDYSERVDAESAVDAVDAAAAALLLEYTETPPTLDDLASLPGSLDATLDKAGPSDWMQRRTLIIGR